jgi:RHS repeat-associated protein
MSYDGRNRCVSRTVNGTTTFLFYESWNLIEERDGSGAEIARYVHGAQIDEMVTLTARPSTLNQIYSYHHDSLGSVTHLTDLSGAVVERYIYDVFGALAILGPQCAALATSAVGNRVLFTGREYLEGIGCYDYRQRTYLPVLGRLLQTDPSRFVGGDVNWYRYVVNDAASLRDPFGLWPWDTYNEVVGSEAFQAGTGWKPTSFSLKTSVEQNFMAWVEGFAMKFEAEVCVSCQCGSKTKRACGKRVACLDESFDQRDQFPTRANRPLPFEIPTSIGELLGELLDQVLPTLTVLEPENLQFIGAQIRHKMPRQAADGAWEGGKSPCSKLWW